MNPLMQRKIALERAMDAGASLIEFADVIRFALDNAANDWRVPFEQHDDRILVGTEWFHLLSGAAHYRTILMYRKAPYWYPESTIGRLTAFEVYCASQNQPPDDNVYDKERGRPCDYAADAQFSDVVDYENWKEEPRRAQVFGASYGGTRQKLLTEAPPDLSNPIQASATKYPDPKLRKVIANPLPTVYQQVKRYARELGESDTFAAVEKRNELDAWLRKYSKAASKQGTGDIVAAADAWLHSKYFRGQPRSLPGSRRAVADRVRKNCKYFLEMLYASDNAITREIAAYLDENVRVGATCEHRGNWLFRF